MLVSSVLLPSNFLKMQRYGNFSQFSIDTVIKMTLSIYMQGANDFTLETMSRISMSVDPTNNIGSCDLVVEAIVENITIKQQLFKQLDETAPS